MTISMLNNWDTRIPLEPMYRESVRSPSINARPIPYQIKYVAVVVPVTFDL